MPISPQTEQKLLAFLEREEHREARRVERKGARRAVGRASLLIFAALLCMQCFSVLMQILLLRFGAYTGDLATAWGCAVYLTLALVPLFYVYAARRSGQPLGIFLPQSRPKAVGLSGLAAGLLLLAAFGAILAANFPVDLVSRLLDWFRLSHTPSMPEVQTGWGLAFGLVYSALAAPLTEEFLFRGVVLGVLRPHGDGFAIVVSAVLFGLYHGNVEQFVFAFLVGLVLSYVRVRTDNLWWCVLLHGANNFLATFYTTVATLWGGAAASLYVDAYTFFFVVLGIVALFLCLRWFGTKTLQLMHIPFESPLSQRCAQIFCSLGGWVMLLYGGISSAFALGGIV